MVRHFDLEGTFLKYKNTEINYILALSDNVVDDKQIYNEIGYCEC